MIVSTLKFLFLFYCIVVAAIFVIQRKIMYFPDPHVLPIPADAQKIRVTTQDHLALTGWYFENDKKKPTIIYFHGNAGNFSHRTPKIRHYTQAGYNVLLTEYRGYGGNSGKPNEEGLYADARAYITWLKNEKSVSDDKIILYGESLGTGIAVQMATEFPVAALVLETPYNSMVFTASEHYPFLPVSFLLLDRYESNRKIVSLRNIPTLFLHGHKDTTISFTCARKLYELAPEPKKFMEFPEGNHNNLYALGAGQHILDFIAGLNLENKDNSSVE